MGKLVKRMSKRDLIRRIGNDICEGCDLSETGEVLTDCGCDKAGECERLNNAGHALALWVKHRTGVSV